MNVNKFSAISNFLWRFLEKFGAQSVTLIVSIVLARLLDPNIYGTVALITVFTNILGVFVEGGLGSALIQKKDADDVDFSSVFYLNVMFSVLCYCLMFFAAPYIAYFFTNPNLCNMIRVLSLIIIISATKNIQQAYVSKNLMFKKFFFSTLGGTVAAAIVGIVLALKGFGAWALIAQYLINAFIDTTVLWITVKWRPKKVFSINRIRTLFSFGWKLMLSGLIYAIYNDFRQVIIGKKYSPSDLAYYEKAYTFPRYSVILVNSSIDSILFPIMSNNQEDLSSLKQLTRKTIRLSTYVMFPLMAGLFLCAEPIIVLILSEKWVASAIYLRVFCVACSLWSFDTANQNVLKATGRSNYLLVIEIIETVIGVISLLIAMNYGAFGIAIAWCISMLINQFIVSIPNKKILNYGYLAQIIDILPNLGITAIMAVIVWIISFLQFDRNLVLIIQILIGILVYCFLSIVTRNESFSILYEYLKLFLKKRKTRE